jgi:hypothetical protein
MKQNIRPRNKSTQLQPFDFFYKGTQNICGEKKSSSTNGAGKTHYLNAKD